MDGKPPPMQRNSKGGILVTEEDISDAFRLLHRHGAGAGGQGGRISLAALTERVTALFPDATKEDVRALLGEDPKGGLTSKMLADLLLDNTITSYDPADTAFRRVFDPRGAGHVDAQALKDVWAQLGFAPLTDEDIALLTAAVGRNGRISLHDFSRMLAAPRTRKATREELGRAPED
jgi:Ca2+-binding EF-hand superfamily protein